MSAEEEAAAARAAGMEADAARVPGTPPPSQPPQFPQTPIQTPGIGGYDATGTGNVPSIHELMGKMVQMMAMMQNDKKPEKERLANCRLDEKYFRTVGRFDNTRSSWKEWRSHFLNAIRECDVGFTTVVEVNETSEEPIDIVPLDPTETQLATNMYNRLTACTSGLAFQIVESVTDYNGLEAWRLLAKQFDPKTDARLTNLVMSIIGHKIKGKNVQAGLIAWEGWLLQLQRDHHEDLSEKVKRAFLMNVLPSSLQSKVMEHLDRLKTYKEVRDKVISLCHNLEETDIGSMDDSSPLAGGYAPTGEGDDHDDWEGWWTDDNNGWHAP